MKLALLRAAARRPLLSLALVVALAGAVLFAGVRLVGQAVAPRDAVTESDVVAAPEPRHILNRVWFDRLPEKRNEVYDVWIWLSGGLAFYERGARYQGSYELFDFERQNDKLRVTSLHDKKTTETSFRVEKCTDKPPFDLCLTLDKSPRGATRLYGFAYESDEDAAVPWAASIRRSARERSR